ncbi:MAG: CPBP family intramembrane glutamic endopeptidase [candidate division WOR-3 bacterium]|nr:CPBP family intramembrane glutamic endopeptidase [candidate division WOR-3 bacterium]
MNKTSTRKAMVFIGLTFLFNWLLAGLFFASGGELNTPAGLAMTVFYMFIPMIVAIIVQKGIYKESIKEPLGISFKLNRWFLVAWLLPPIMAFATLGVSLFFTGVEYSPQMAGMFERFKYLLTPEQLEQMRNQTSILPIHPIWIGLLQGLVAGITINAVAGFGEELGWRGFLQREFAYMGFWKSSMLIGFIWGAWHAPIILRGHNYPEHPVTGVFMMIAWCILLAPTFSYIRLRAKSVIAAAIVHGSLNGTAGLAIMVVKGGNDLIIGVTGLAGFIVLVLVNFGLFVYDPASTKGPVTLQVKPDA